MDGLAIIMLMRGAMFRVVTAVLLASMLAGCASVSTPDAQKPRISSIAIVPATPPQSYSLKNVTAVQFMFPIVGVGYALDSMNKTDLLTARLQKGDTSLADVLTNSVAQALREAGYRVVVMDGIKRVPGDPDDIDYDKLGYREDALLHLYFSDVGLYSSRTSISYVPRVNAKAVVYAKNYPGQLYDTTIYYGADASDRGADTWAIAADPRFSYPDFDDVLKNLGSVQEAFNTGASKIGKRLAAQLVAALR